jgi:NADPH2:quinone reductase
MTETTTAARLHRHGEPLVVEHVPLAGAGENLVRVELEYAGVNPVDRYIAAGLVAPDGPLPRTLGGEAAGRAGGRSVLVTGGGLGAAQDGVWAQAAIVPAETIVELPAGVDTRRAAAMGVAGLTAWNCVHDLAKVRREDRVLVLGAGGGVGSMIVSLARAAGATVWGQTGSPEKAGLIARLGADHVVVSDAAGLPGRIVELAPTVAFDPLGGAFVPAVVDALASRGRIVTFGTSAGADVAFNMQTLYRRSARILGYGGMQLTQDERRAGLAAALSALADGALRVEIDEAVPLERVGDAFARLERRQVSGKLLLDLRG